MSIDKNTLIEDRRNMVDCNIIAGSVNIFPDYYSYKRVHVLEAQTIGRVSCILKVYMGLMQNIALISEDNVPLATIDAVVGGNSEIYRYFKAVNDAS